MIEQFPRLEAQSAGLSRVGTCLQASGGMALRMVAILFPTNVLYRLGFPSNHANAMELSHHANTIEITKQLSYMAFRMLPRRPTLQ